MEKVNGSVKKGIFVEKQIVLVTATFAASIAGTTQYSGFDVVESCLSQLIKHLETRGTVLGVSSLSASGLKVQVMLGYASGFFSDASGIISTGTSVVGKAVDLTDPLLPVPAADLATTFDLSFALWDASLPNATLANGGLVNGPGNVPGYYPVQLNSL